MTDSGLNEEAAALSSGTVWDEMVTGAGRVRPYWRTLMGRLSPLDAGSMEDRRDEAIQLLRQHGATYAIYGDPKGSERPWPLDLIPLLLPGDEWETIEAGAIQRARVLEAVLADLYGPQRLVADGILPPFLLQGDPSFLRTCHGLNRRGERFLHFVAFDLARDPTGSWRVLADKTRAPSGAGYALANRAVVGRVLADCVSDARVQPLAPFFAAFRDSLNGLVPNGRREEPRVVLLTPGPYNETYFEHVYLAHQLGITLAEGSDLTVRDRAVFLKTLSGLKPVGVILRRLDDDFCDPLELRVSSALGIPGLTEAVRAGTVVIANALGSGLMESPGFKPLMGKMARALIGADPLLADVPSWWCGRADDRAHVLAHLDRLVVKPVFSGTTIQPVFGGELSRSARQTLVREIADAPAHYVAQEWTPLSTGPVWEGGRLEPRPLVLRVFVAAVGDDFAVMPGGLTRTATGQGPNVSMQLGGGSKDTWVIGPAWRADSRPAAQPASKIVPLTHTQRKPAAEELPSRVADSLFWIGRYAERTDGIVKLLRTLLVGVTDAVQPWRQRDAEPILNFAAWLGLVPLLDQANSFQAVALVQGALLDPQHPGGVIANLQYLVGAGRRVRDRLPPDCWRIIMAFDRHTIGVDGRAAPVRLLLRLEELVTLGAALGGAVGGAMPRDAGWRFVEIGRRLERALYLVAMMRGIAMPPQSGGGRPKSVDERRMLAAILSLTDARAGGEHAIRGDGLFDRTTVLTAVLANDADPRSLTFQLAALAQHLAALPRPSDRAPSSGGLVALAENLAASARGLVSEAILEGSRSHLGRTRGEAQDPLRNAFRRLEILLGEISDLLTQAYFAHAVVRSA
jgi:uncharacterized circularly permuted ATP-grasp superfamily protein/uncharacterized alpha-E superfamily protein